MMARRPLYWLRAGAKNKPLRVVIVGGGAGGLELATRLGRRFRRGGRGTVTLVDRQPLHIWKPLLHEVASGSLDIDLEGVDYRAHATQNGFDFQLGTLCGIDRSRHQIELESVISKDGSVLVPARRLDYDILVLAVGSLSNDFAVPGVHEFCHTLDGTDDAERLHQVLLEQFLRLKLMKKADKLSVAVIGGGATGVELVAELYKLVDSLPVYGFRGIQRQSLEVSLIEAAPRILSGLPKRISEHTSSVLAALGVRVITGLAVSSIDRNTLYFDSGTQQNADIVIWCAGIKCPEVLRNLGGLTVNSINQVVVDQSLCSVDDPAIYALGDCAACVQGDGRPIPPCAQAAHQMSAYLYRNFLRQIKGQLPRPFNYRDHGSLVSFADYSAIGVIAGLLGSSFFVEGSIAKHLYISLYRFHQLALHGYWRTALLVFVGMINRRLRPALKLH